jgi:hypothetical protein
MPVLRYRCPIAGKFAEVWTELEGDEEQEQSTYFDTVYCNACGRTHLVDPNTGRVAGESE